MAIHKLFKFYYKEKFLQEASKIKSIDYYLDLLYTKYYYFISPWQSRSELTRLLELIQELKPSTIAEIGTANGGSLFLFSRLAAPDARIVSVDLPNVKFGGGYKSWRKNFFKKMVLPKQDLHLLIGDSHSSKMLGKVQILLPGKKVDFLFIDGDHTYNGVKKDFEMYSPFVRKGGMIAFHDIVKGDPELVGEVSKFWNEIKIQYRHLEIIENPDQKIFGIGVVFAN
ncbi:MAG: class I SAM-dependent methyltransferase [Bacteroidetes bacterium]|nr:class I SAM-dependent methyltransferase [Bacteroidota bacterium]HET6242911.1 class I SAM-dependent methyltransferase [Bacteroidia bacterium]